MAKLTSSDAARVAGVGSHGRRPAPFSEGCCMSHMYVDPYAMLDVTYLVAAFLIDGHGAEDGEYVIVVSAGSRGCRRAAGAGLPDAADQGCRLYRDWPYGERLRGGASRAGGR